MSLIISAGTLGELARPDFCPRCFWIRLKCEKLPFQIAMPGIFSSIDSYVKKVVHRYYEKEGKLPEWFPYVGEVVKLEKTPSYHQFMITDPQTGVTLRGTPDDLFQLQDSSYHIVDYKTARLTTKQDELFPGYEVQLNAYAYIGNRTCFSPVSALTLVYLDPDTDFNSSPDLLSRSEDQLMLGFTPKTKSVEVKPQSFIEELLNRASEINELEVPPPHISGCEDCQLLENLIRIAPIYRG
ncbi:MAG: PD-(D/E)XK nuclease family protein [Dehalococcoidia bacterium]|nr:PD-(D/E)XK nuclease family protein [Dehalococcoidia bacterium]